MLPNTPNLNDLLKQGLGTTFDKLTTTQVEIVVKRDLPNGESIRKSVITSIVQCSRPVAESKLLVHQGVGDE